MSKRIGGSKPRLDRRKMIPNPIRMYAEIADFDFMMFSPLSSSPVISKGVNQILSKSDKNTIGIFGN